jgi:hypothetical protein
MIFFHSFPERVACITPSESQTTLAMILPVDSYILKILSLQKSYCTNYRHLNMAWSLPHTVDLTYGEFLLVSLYISLGI